MQHTNNFITTMQATTTDFTSDLPAFYGEVNKYVLDFFTPAQRKLVTDKQRKGSEFFCWFQVPCLGYPKPQPTRILFGISEAFADDDDEVEMERFILGMNSSIKLTEYTLSFSVEKATEILAKLVPDPDRSDISISKEEMLLEFKGEPVPFL